MTANFLFPKTISQTQSPGIEGGKIKVCVHDSAAVRNTADKSSGNDGDSFLNTMKQIAKDLNPTRPSRAAGEMRSSKTHTFDSAEKLDTSDQLTDALEIGVIEKTIPSGNDLDSAAVQMPHTLNFLEIIQTLEKLGILDSAGGSNTPTKADENLSDEAGGAALKMLMTRLEQYDFGPIVEMKAELDRLQQIIANAQTGDASFHSDGNPVVELTDSLSTRHLDLYQLLKRIVSSQEEMGGNTSGRIVESDLGEKPSGPLAATLQNDTRQTGSLQPAEDSQPVSRSENQEKTDSLKLTVEARTVGAEDSENAKELRPLETFRPDDSRRKDGLDTPSKTVASSQTGLLKWISTTIDSGKQLGGESAQKNLPNNETAPVIKMTSDAQTAKASNPEYRYDGEPVQNNALNNVSSPVSKMIHDSILAKENQIRMNAALSDELGGKVIKVDAGANDNGLLSSQNQSAEKAFEATSLSKQADTGQDSIRTHTLDQIIRKAVIYMRNGQHEAKIDLKPEFLGHVRMQVTTENHQVTVKILTEFGFVKDMVENNIQQLKADLQQQGLNVDKLEVAVSNDSDEHKQPQEKAGLSKKRQHNTARISSVNREEETREQTRDFGLKRAGVATVDYFA